MLTPVTRKTPTLHLLLWLALFSHSLVSFSHAQPAEVTARIGAGPVFAPCDENTDGVLIRGNTYVITYSAKSVLLQDGATLGFTIYSPDGSMNNSTVNYVTLLGEWATLTYWTLGGGLLTLDTNGTLPESFLTGGAALPGGGFQESAFVDIAELSVTLANNDGFICFDSAFYPPVGEWLLSPDGPPLWLGGGGDFGLGGARPDAFCYESRFASAPLSPQDLPCGSSCISYTSIALTDCDTLEFRVEIGGCEFGSFNFTATVTEGFGSISLDDSLNLIYIPSSLDTLTGYSVIAIGYDYPAIDICGNQFTAHCEPTISIIVQSCLCCDVPGDADHSGSLTIADVTFNIARIFTGGVKSRCPFEADADGSGSLTIGDVTYVIARIFSGGPEPICPSQGG